jgi:hypothetical protein
VLTVGVVAVLVTAFVLALAMHLRLSRWFERPYPMIFL